MHELVYTDRQNVCSAVLHTHAQCATNRVIDELCRARTTVHQVSLVANGCFVGCCALRVCLSAAAKTQADCLVARLHVTYVFDNNSDQL
jgi:hypothetical protein